MVGAEGEQAPQAGAAAVQGLTGEKGPTDHALLQRYLSHEFRSHLSVVVSAATLLSQRWAAADANGQKLCAALRDSSAMLIRLVDDWSRSMVVTSNAFSVDCRPLLLKPWLTCWLNSCELAKPRHSESEGVRPSLLFSAADDVQVLVDPQRLGQCLFNLVSNAFKYGDDPARVVLEVHSVPDTVLIVIADAGRGLDADQIEQLFRPFARLQAHAAIPGEGLGLSLTRLLVEAMGGRVSVESTVGVGTRFSLALRRV